MKRQITQEIPEEFKKEFGELPPFHSQIFDDLSPRDIEAMAQVTQGIGRSDPGSWWVTLYEHLNRVFVDPSDRQLARTILDALRRLPPEVSRAAVFFLSVEAYFVQESVEFSISEVRQASKIDSSRIEWLGGIVEALRKLRESEDEAADFEPFDVLTLPPIAILELPPMKRLRVELGLSLRTSGLSSAIEKLEKITEENLRRLRENRRVDRAEWMRKEGSVPGTLRKGDVAPLVYDLFEAAVELMAQATKMSDPRAQTLRVFSLWGIEINEESARKARNRKKTK